MKLHWLGLGGALALCLIALSACAQLDSAEQGQHAEDVRRPATSAVSPATENSAYADNPVAKETPRMPNTEESALPARGAAIPAAELRTRILKLIGSLQTAADANAQHAEALLGARLEPYPGSSSMLLYPGQVTEGWNYDVVVVPSGDKSASQIDVRLSLKDTRKSAAPKTCPYDFESLADDIVALGYERTARSFVFAGRESWGFNKDISANNIGFGIGLYVFRVEDSSQAGYRNCIESIEIGFRVIK
jgi:hypothetical protein